MAPIGSVGTDRHERVNRPFGPIGYMGRGGGHWGELRPRCRFKREAARECGNHPRDMAAAPVAASHAA